MMLAVCLRWKLGMSAQLRMEGHVRQPRPEPKRNADVPLVAIFAMAVVCAANSCAARRVSWHMLLGCACGRLLDGCCITFAGTGPIYAFDKRGFPDHSIASKDLSPIFALEKMSISTASLVMPMPFVTYGMGRLLWWNSRGLPRALRRATVIL